MSGARSKGQQAQNVLHPLAEWRTVVKPDGCAPGGAPDSRVVVFRNQVAHDAQGHVRGLCSGVTGSRHGNHSDHRN